MDPSILVVGNQILHRIIAKLLSKAQDLVLGTVEVADAESIIHAQQPDILIVQADDCAAVSLSQRIQQQSRLTWIYQIFVGHSLNEQVREMELDIAKALEQGADSYFSSLTLIELEESMSEGRIDVLENQQRLLKAHIRAGLRRVQKNRELVQANDLLSSIALSDPLTELNNRRAFEWELPRQIQAARARAMPVSLLMLDIDFFKRINDQHGHIVGDQALQMVANRIRNNLRFYDTPFRYGGEEFSIILNNTPLQDAIQIGQRICHLISEQPFVIDAKLQLNITLSIGSASLIMEDDDKGLSLLHRADQNLLIAKESGRNQLVSDKAHRNIVHGQGEENSNDLDDSSSLDHSQPHSLMHLSQKVII
ncbi:MAG: diguanylate cyclase [Cyanobacteria bacterium P01_F01_bin.150]